MIQKQQCNIHFLYGGHTVIMKMILKNQSNIGLFCIEQNCAKRAKYLLFVPITLKSELYKIDYPHQTGKKLFVP